MKYPKINKQLIVTITEEEKEKIIQASIMSYRTITSIAREGTIEKANQILGSKSGDTNATN